MKTEILNILESEYRLLGVLAKQNEEAAEKEPSGQWKLYYEARAGAFQKSQERLRGVIIKVSQEIKEA